MIMDEITEENCTAVLIKALRVFKATSPSVGQFKAKLHDGSKLSVAFKWSKKQHERLEEAVPCIMCNKYIGTEDIPESPSQRACLVCADRAGFATKDA